MRTIPCGEKRSGALLKRPLPLMTIGIIVPNVMPTAERMAPVRAAPILITQIKYSTFATPQAPTEYLK